MTHGDTILLLIDWQQGFHDAAFWGPRNNPDAEGAATRLIAGCRAVQVPVWHVHHLSLELGSPLTAGAPGARPLDFAVPKAGEPIFTKSVNSAFIGTDLKDRLHSQGITRLIISGISTDHCVSTSTRMPANLGFTVLLVGEACFTFDRTSPTGQGVPADQVHLANLASLHQEFAQVVSVEEALAA